jgi:ABC-type antimicrobial peptide transport system permease subunit
MSILGLFTKEVITLTLIAFVVAAPLGYLVMNRWLEDYTYRITLSYEYFGVSFLITLVIAMITISHRSISSAIINPAMTLKDE